VSEVNVIDTIIGRMEWGCVCVLDEDMARITVNWAGYLEPAYWLGRGSDESTPQFHRRVVDEAARHGPKLLRLTRERYEAICREIEDDG
jgi:hypothetical protein